MWIWGFRVANKKANHLGSLFFDSTRRYFFLAAFLAGFLAAALAVFLAGFLAVFFAFLVVAMSVSFLWLTWCLSPRRWYYSVFI
jgi:hypothetical protein